jgi:mxaJ protein
VTGRWTFSIYVATVLVLFLMNGGSSGNVQGWELRVCADPDGLPYSNRLEKGFENKIAEILARELDARLSYVWLPQPHTRARDLFIQEGRCDLVMGIPEGHPGFLNSLAYYRTTYVFVYRKDSLYKISSFDDPNLKELTIGVQLSGGTISPTSYALAKRGLIDNQLGFEADYRTPNPFSSIVTAVVDGEIDVGIVWGPIAGYFAQKYPDELELVPVQPQIEMPFVAMVAPISVGVRLDDEALRDSLDVALTKRWDDIQEVLETYGVPLEPLSKPALGQRGP